MADEQSQHEKPEDMVESSQALEREAARSLEDAADSHATLQGFFAVNDERAPEGTAPDEDRDKRPAENRGKGHSVP